MIHVAAYPWPPRRDMGRFGKSSAMIFPCDSRLDDLQRPKIGIISVKLCERSPTQMSRGLFKPSIRLSSRSRTPSSCQCANISATPSSLRHPSRGLATSITRQDEYSAPSEERPRWQGAPERMYAPVRIPKNYARPSDIFPVNTSSSVLNEAYVNILGNGGDEVLTEEVKWLAVTHKSFDHGRRGYNDRLSVLGMKFYTGFT